MKLSHYTVFAPDLVRDDAATADFSQVIAANLLSRAVIRVPAHIQELLTGDASSLHRLKNDYPDLFFYLEQHHFVQQDSFDELLFLKDKVNSARYQDDELGLVIAPTMGCNLNCHYCFEAKTATTLDSAGQQKLIALVQSQLAGKKRLTVQWFGGEPLLAMDVIENLSCEFARLCSTYGVHYSANMITNGYHLSAPVSEKLKQWGITTVQITLEGNRQLHDKVRTDTERTPTFDRILDNIRLASEYLQIDLRLHVAPYNVGGIKDLILYLADEGFAQRLSVLYFAPIFSFRPTDKVKFDHDDHRFFTVPTFAPIEAELYALAKELGFPIPDIFNESFSVCTAVKDHTLTVDANGELHKCYFDLNHSDQSIGNLDKGVLDNETHQGWMNHRIDRDQECRDCQFLPVCFGGCTRKWRENADKSTICTPLKYNFAQMAPIFFSVPARESIRV
jgi:uncharacterized protein